MPGPNDRSLVRDPRGRWFQEEGDHREIPRDKSRSRRISLYGATGSCPLSGTFLSRGGEGVDNATRRSIEKGNGRETLDETTRWRWSTVVKEVEEEEEEEEGEGRGGER